MTPLRSNIADDGDEVLCLRAFPLGTCGPLSMRRNFLHPSPLREFERRLAGRQKAAFVGTKIIAALRSATFLPSARKKVVIGEATNQCAASVKRRATYFL